jgi:hypothetical protein
MASQKMLNRDILPTSIVVFRTVHNIIRVVEIIMLFGHMKCEFLGPFNSIEYRFNFINWRFYISN